MLKNKFTLVELIVVIAILAILASLLTPSLRKTLEMTNLISCSNNYKKLYITFELYINDHQFYPYAISSFQGGTHGAITWDDYLGAGYDDRNLNLRDRAIKNEWSPVDKSNYGSKDMVQQYACPSDSERDETQYYKRSYSMNVNQYWWSNQGYSNYWAVNNRSKPRWSASVDDIDNPAQTILLTERQKGYLGSPGHAGTATPSNLIEEAMHFSENNFLFGDGHSEKLFANETWDETRPVTVAGKYWTRQSND